MEEDFLNKGKYLDLICEGKRNIFSTCEEISLDKRSKWGEWVSLHIHMI